MNERDIPQYQIADQVNVDPSTISRELNRNASRDGYDPDDAHRQAEQRQQDKNRTRIDQDDWDQVEKLLQLDWSPEQIAGRLDKNGKLDISHEWIYQHVWQDKNEGGTLYENLRLGRENRKAYGTRNSHTTIKNRTSIEERPDVVDDRKRVGDWETDLIIGKGHSGALVTLVERKTRFVMIGHVKRKTADAVRQKQVELLSPLKDDVHTMTQDNGGERIETRKAVNRMYFDADITKKELVETFDVSTNFVMKWTQTPDQNFEEDDRGWEKGRRRNWDQEVVHRIKQIRQELEGDPYETFWGPSAIEVVYRKRFPHLKVPPSRIIRCD